LVNNPLRLSLAGSTQTASDLGALASYSHLPLQVLRTEGEADLRTLQQSLSGGVPTTQA